MDRRNQSNNPSDPVQYQLGDAMQADGHEWELWCRISAWGSGDVEGEMMNHLRVLGQRC
jgi:hypothetical protein